MKLTLASVAAAMACTQLIQAAPINVNGRTCLEDKDGCGYIGSEDSNKEIEKQWGKYLVPVKNDHDKSGFGLLGIPSSAWRDRDFQDLVKKAYQQFALTHPSAVKMSGSTQPLYRADTLPPYTNKFRRSTQDDGEASAVDIAAAT